MNLIKDTPTRQVYESADGVRFYVCKKGEVLGDNEINPKETIYVTEGSAEIIIGGETGQVKAPAQVIIPEKTYHKIIAKTDIKFLLFNN